MFDLIHKKINNEFLETLHPRGSYGKFKVKFIGDSLTPQPKDGGRKRSSLFFDLYEDKNMFFEWEDKEEREDKRI
jgi:hypothetical protein